MPFSSNIKLLFCGHDLKFITPLIRQMESAPGYTVKILEHKGHYINDPKAADDALDWADVIFCEWALGNAVWFSERKRPNQVLIVRLHLQEVQSRSRIDFIWRTNWDKVDRLILITQHVYDWMRAEFPVLAGKTALVYNPIPARTAYALPKSPDSRFTLGLVGVVPARKRLDLAVAVLRRLRETDASYSLRVKGALPTDYAWMANRTEEMAWYTRIFDELAGLRKAGSVVFDPHGSDMAGWYQGIGHILSVSDFEGSHQAVAEGMASGCVPAIRDWEGAGRIYPPKYVEGSIESLAGMILRNSQLETFMAESDYARRFAQERFDNEPTCSALIGIIAQEVRFKRRGRVSAGLVQEARRRPNFLIVAYIPEGSRSGYRIRVEQEIQALTQQGCKVHLACLLPRPEAGSSSDEQNPTRAAHSDEFTEMGCEPHLIEVEDFFRMNATPESFQGIAAQLIDIVEQFDIDVVHAEALYCARVALAVKAARPSTVFSIDWHGVVPEEARMGGAHEARIASLEKAERQLLAAGDLNVFVSEAMGTHYRRKYGEILPAQVIVPCCVSDRRFVQPAEPKRRTLFPPGSLVFGYAGTMADWQCGAEMIELFAALHREDGRCRFLLLVPKSDQDKAIEYCTAARLPVEAMVMLEVPHDEVPLRLRDCDVGVLIRRPDPVNFVSSPTKFGEYLAAGLPVLMTDAIGDYSRLASDRVVGFVLDAPSLFGISKRSLPPELLRRVVEFAVRSAASRNVDAPQCQSVAREELHWEAASARWLASYVSGPG
jgi:glycosyltransferase involved in cell wall biosynthesis